MSAVPSTPSWFGPYSWRRVLRVSAPPLPHAEPEPGGDDAPEGPESRQDDQDAEQHDGQGQERREEDQQEAQDQEHHPAPDERADVAGAEKLGRGLSEAVEARGQVVDRRIGRAYVPGGARLVS